MSNTENTTAWDPEVFFALATTAAATRNTLRNAWLECFGPSEESNRLYAEYTAMDWHLDLRDKFALHPAVDQLVREHRPTDYNKLWLEWPHVSTMDQGRLAYTRDETAGKANRQTVTSVGKYLRRHWASLPDHVIRDAVARYTPDRVELGTGIQFLIRAAEFGPRSCMQSSYGTIPFSGEDHAALKRWIGNPENEEPAWHKHPYAVYVPEFGWGMCIRISSDGQIVGRCLTWINPEDPAQKVFVRSYARNKQGDDYRSESDHTIEAWLKDQGYEQRRHWPEGSRMAMLTHPTRGDHNLLPYLDAGDCDFRRVSIGYDGALSREFFYRDDCGEYRCDCTDGTAFYLGSQDDEDEDDENMTYCEDCDSRVHIDETSAVGYHRERYVCQCCLDDDYTFVRGSGRWGRDDYYAPNADAEPVYGCYRTMRSCSEEYHVDTAHLPDDVVYLDDDECYAESGSVVYCIDEVWRFEDDPAVVHLEDNCPHSGETWAHLNDVWADADGNWFSCHEEFTVFDGQKYRKSDCWECAGTGLWYPDFEEYVTDDEGNTYSADYLDPVNSDAEWGIDDAVAEALCRPAAYPQPAVLSSELFTLAA